MGLGMRGRVRPPAPAGFAAGVLRFVVSFACGGMMRWGLGR